MGQLKGIVEPPTGDRLTNTCQEGNQSRGAHAGKGSTTQKKPGAEEIQGVGKEGDYGRGGMHAKTEDESG